MTKKKFLDEHFLLNTTTAQRLYHEFAKEMPIIDYHCHLPPAQIAADASFENLTQAWLYGDHYKWRAMRTNGIHESYCTGDKNDYEKFEKWAATVPYTLRNPLYHWTHLELQRYFDINEVLNPTSARRIYNTASEMLQQPSHSVRSLLSRMNVALVCTTDDPADNLEHHISMKQEGYDTPILPAFRPDASMNADDPVAYNKYLGRLEQAANISIASYDDLLQALKSRHDFFAAQGCSVSDHGIEEIHAEEFTAVEINEIFRTVRAGKQLEPLALRKFKSALLLQLAEWDWEKGWVQQYHLGALRNNNSRMMRILGPDTGWDSIGDFSQARALAKFLDRLDSQDKLAKTILYNLNPADNELLATMIGNFNDGSVAGKVQFGSAWWFLDQKDGMRKQLDALSNMSLLSRFVGMLTDSRSFLSFPRHEYFRRLLCDLLGSEIENGELPDDVNWVGKVVQDICFHNARQYFNWQHLDKKVAAGLSV
ncbi:glucuronate isomerase [Chitinophaga horti]|uniref:Uronate isomerase n=1 Tax=Chitinophaga horti TaxID=2920382 RepID=A0ABY6J5D2_9BACT|nr:glucuronate isomerase [Chitinophaga horti]UYQ94883.1 glucuronate isomerase [Chitinophaga horti]